MELVIQKSDLYPKDFSGDWEAHAREVARKRSAPVSMPEQHLKNIQNDISDASKTLMSIREKIRVEGMILDAAAENHRAEIARLNCELEYLKDIREAYVSNSPEVYSVVVAASEHFNTSRSSIVSRCQAVPLPAIRAEIYWLLKNKAKMSLNLIGKLMGNRNHTTIMFAVRRLQARIDSGKTAEPAWWLPTNVREG